MKILLDYFELKKNIQNMFDKAGIDDYADIDWIMVEVTGKSRSMLPFYGKFSTEETKQIMDAVEKRLKHIPLAYIFGKTNFYGFDFEVDKNVLIPRIDTEILIEKLVDEIKKSNKQCSVLDIGTGSGVIAICLKKLTDANVVAVDVSENALKIASKNAKINNAEIEFVKSDLFSKIGEKRFDFIVSNPPYIESDVVLTLDAEVVENEPILALDGGKDGLDFYRKIISQAPNHLNKNGKLFFEIGYNQAEAVCDLMSKDFKNIEVYKDYGNNDRVVVGELKWLKD